MLGKSEKLSYTMINSEMYVQCTDAKGTVYWTEFVFKEKVEQMREALEIHEDHLAQSAPQPNQQMKPKFDELINDIFDGKSAAVNASNNNKGFSSD